VDESELSSIKSVVSSIIKTLDDPRSTAKDLRDIIQIDPPLTAKVLKVVNSSYYSLRNKVSDITHAVILIGFDAVKELALNQKVCEIFKQNGATHQYSRPSLWKHSVAVAILAKLISRREFRQGGENSYAAGLLHDIGIIAEDQFLQDQFRRVLYESQTQKTSLSQAERKVLGYNHAQIGMAIARKWDLPEELVMSIGYHHDPDKAPKAYRKLASILYVADYFCLDGGVGYGDQPLEDDGVFRRSLRELKVESRSLDLIWEDVKQEMSKMEDQGSLWHETS